jgi:hypothetical protein
VTEWTPEGYWNAVLGARDARDCIVEFDLGDREAIDARLEQAEDEAWEAGALEGDRPAAWADFRVQVARQLGEKLAELLAEARKLGAEGGFADAQNVYHEQGIDVIRKSLEPGHAAWGEGAACADAAGEDGVPRVQALRDAYYEAYADAGREKAEEFVRESQDEPDEPDEPVMKIIRARYRDLNARGRGSECFRRVVDLATKTSRWATSAGIVTGDDWCERGIRASERRCSTRVELPVGTLLIDIDRSIGYGGSRATYRCAVVVDEKDGVVYESDERCPYEHVGVKKGAGYVHVLKEKASGKRVEISE